MNAPESLTLSAMALVALGVVVVILDQLAPVILDWSESVRRYRQTSRRRRTPAPRRAVRR